MSTATQSFTDTIALRGEHGYASVERDEAIQAIRTALKTRTGRTWSVTGGRGTAWGWITVTAPPKRRTGLRVEDGVYPPEHFRAGDKRWTLIDSGKPQRFGLMTPEDVATLSAIFGEAVSDQGHMIPAGSDFRIQAIAHAEGRVSSVDAVPYWD